MNFKKCLVRMIFFVFSIAWLVSSAGCSANTLSGSANTSDPIPDTNLYPEAAYIFQETDAEALSANNIFYVATNGSDSNPGTETLPWLTIQKAANTLQPGQKVYVKEGVYRERVMVTKSGTSGNTIVYSAYPGNQVIIEGRGIHPLNPNPASSFWCGLFYIHSASWIKVKGFKVRNSSTTGIFSDNSDHLIIENNFIYHSWASGIGTWFGKDILVDGNEIVAACDSSSVSNNSDYIQENMSIANCDHFEVRNNIIHHGGKASNFGGEGLDVKNSMNGIVHHNIVHDLPKVGFYVDSWDNPHSTNIELYDNSSYSNHNWGMALASENGGTLENIRVYNNLVYDNDMPGIGVEGGKGWGIGVHHYLKKLYIYNNTIVNNGNVSKWAPGIRVCAPEGEDVFIRNNILFGNYNNSVSVADNGTPVNLVIENNLTDADPGFADSLNHNYHLKAGSPAIDAANSSSAPAVDFDGTARPRGLGYDAGAFEY